MQRDLYCIRTTSTASEKGALMRQVKPRDGLGDTVAVVQVRDDGGLGHLSSSAVGEKWSDFIYCAHGVSIIC